ncbi:MAG TPA: hypothetical protein VM432_00815, partial [Bdellovibrionales bacterium]|nr:hypothetical protein [Bdellovibrionales bacterium]
MGKRFGRYLHRGLRTLNALVLVTGVAVSPIAHALQTTLQVSLKKELKVRTLDSLKMTAVATLPVGSVVQIPVQFQVLGNDGKVDLDLTLNNWLKKAGYSDSEMNPSLNGGERNDFFFPIRVVSAPGLDAEKVEELNQRDTYVALRHLSLQDQALVVDSPAEVFNAPPIKDFTPFRSIEYGQRSEVAAAAEEENSDVPPPPPPPDETVEGLAEASDSENEGQLVCIDGSCVG